MKDVENWAKLLISAPTSTSKEPKKQEEAVEKSVPKKKADKKQKPASAKPAKQKAPKTKAASFDEPVYVVDLSTGNKIDLTVLTIEQLKQFAKDNFNKGYEDLDRDQLILLNSASAIDIKEQARQQGIKNYSKMRKSELIKLLTAKK
jgi:hypothetical protein